MGVHSKVSTCQLPSEQDKEYSKTVDPHGYNYSGFIVTQALETPEVYIYIYTCTLKYIIEVCHVNYLSRLRRSMIQTRSREVMLKTAPAMLHRTRSQRDIPL